jgi:subtilisin family serine protease
MASISFAKIEHYKGPPRVSLATPLVAAAAATLLSQEPNLTPEEVIQRMQTTARRHPSMEGKMKAGGSLDMEALLKTVD